MAIGAVFGPPHDPTLPVEGVVSSNKVGDKWQSSKLDSTRRKQNILNKKKKK
jgi:hypothetical protein